MLNFYGFMPVALGGMGSNRGAVIGGLALGLFQQAANFLVGGIFASVAVFVVFIIVSCWRARRVRRRSERASRLMDVSRRRSVRASVGPVLRGSSARCPDRPGNRRRGAATAAAIPTWA